MNIFRKFFRLRPLSWLFFSIALLVPAFVYVEKMRIEQQYLAANWVCCGEEILRITIIGVIAALLFLMVASVLSAIAFYRLPKPRSKMRLIEVSLLSMPTMVGGAALAYIAYIIFFE